MGPILSDMIYRVFEKQHDLQFSQKLNFKKISILSFYLLQINAFFILFHKNPTSCSVGIVQRERVLFSESSRHSFRHPHCNGEGGENSVARGTWYEEVSHPLQDALIFMSPLPNLHLNDLMAPEDPISSLTSPLPISSLMGSRQLCYCNIRLPQLHQSSHLESDFWLIRDSPEDF